MLANIKAGRVEGQLWGSSVARWKPCGKHRPSKPQREWKGHDHISFAIPRGRKPASIGSMSRQRRESEGNSQGIPLDQMPTDAKKCLYQT